MVVGCGTGRRHRVFLVIMCKSAWTTSTMWMIIVRWRNLFVDVCSMIMIGKDLIRMRMFSRWSGTRKTRRGRRRRGWSDPFIEGGNDLNIRIAVNSSPHRREKKSYTRERRTFVMGRGRCHRLIRSISPFIIQLKSSEESAMWRREKKEAIALLDAEYQQEQTDEGENKK